ncbi:uncharacterized protein LOC118155310 isoform X3 [Callithrix jacchus]
MNACESRGPARGCYVSRRGFSWNRSEFTSLTYSAIGGSKEWILENLNSKEDTFPVSSNDQVSMVRLRPWTEKEDLEEEDLYAGFWGVSSNSTKMTPKVVPVFHRKCDSVMT